MDDEEDASQGGNHSGLGNTAGYGNLSGQYSLTRYPSRPSNELLRGPSGLGQLQEDESEGYGDAPAQSNSSDFFDNAAKSLADSIRGM